ncbi:DUF5681 domain-containing protein [uncultured Thiodictyon sp.]|jgi:hypothetical protein|uniref:DUF5681 domain-containing protein n=1 Tax=uncultured Thiodictyon sp. TaxID=1846217 RepID=UPI0025E61D57|nr:DUF5681 domain-containing protein [uncultured Thiodictyon sp.]
MTQFKPGSSGNPRGRKPGTTTKAGKLRDGIAKDLPEILATLTGLAKSGDVSAARLLLDRALPPLRSVAAPVPVPLGADLTQATGAVLAALAAGSIGTDQASDLASVLSALARVRETVELENRIAALESKR